MSPDARCGEPGVNLWGYLRTESGVGEHARTLLAALDEAQLPVVPIDFPDSRSRRDHPLPLGARDQPGFAVHLICVNADQVPHFCARVGSECLTGYRIGYWHWEVEEFPDAMASSADLVDEIWTASRHSAEAIGRKVARPVHVVPPAVDPPTPAPLPADLLPRGEGALFLTCFDFDSVIERKNPEGVMAAFRCAFPAGGARLLVKSVNGHLHAERLAALTAAAADRSDIRVVDRYLDRAEQAALIAACDVFLSLHRAEGFGLMLAEAMWFARPVIATAYSGNLDFMDESTGRLVPWQSAAIPAGAGPYSGLWAEPDVEAAAAAMRDLAGDETLAGALGRKAAAAIQGGFGVRASAQRLRRNLSRIPIAGAQAMPAEDAGRDLEPLAAVVARGPDPGLPSVLGPIGRALRRAALRLQRHGWLHQRDVDRALIARLADERAARLRLEARLRSEIVREVALAEGRHRRQARATAVEPPIGT